MRVGPDPVLVCGDSVRVDIVVSGGSSITYANSRDATSLGTVAVGTRVAITRPTWIKSTGTFSEVFTVGHQAVDTDDLFADTITADPAVPDGVTDNTAYLQSLLDTATVVGATLRIPPAKSGSWLIQELTLASGARVNATGATFVLPSGVQKRLILNASMKLGTPGSARDSNITLTGGTYDHGNLDGVAALDPNAQTLHFGFIDGLSVRDITVRSSGTNIGGKYAVFVWCCTNFHFDGIDANPSVVSAAIQCSGTIAHGVIRRVTGVTGDDSVAVLPRDGAGLELGTPTFVDIHHIEIEHVYTTSQRNGIKILGGKANDGTTPIKARDITVRNVDGDFGALGGNTAAMWIGGDVNYAPLSGGIVENVFCENVTQQRSEIGIQIRDGAAAVRGLVLRNCRTLSSFKASVNLAATGVADLTILDTVYTFGAAGYAVTIQSGTFLRNLRFRNCRMVAPSAGGPFNIGFLQTINGASIGEVVFDGCASIDYAFVLGEFGTGGFLTINGCFGETVNCEGYLRLVTGAAITIRQANMLSSGTDDVTKVAGTITSEAQNMRCDVNTLQRVANSLAWNTNAGRSCGVGPVKCDGTTWTHVITGATF
jgi:hypothetical protein